MSLLRFTLLAVTLLTLVKCLLCCEDNDKDSILCKGTVLNFLFGIHVYMLENRNITDLSPGSLAALTNFTEIDLSKNSISEIKNEVFNNLNIFTLDLNNNEISSVETKAFDNMPNLRYLKLDNNKLTTWDPNWFQRTPNIHEVSLANNRLSQLPANAFANIRWTHYYDVFVVIGTTVNFKNNSIDYLDPEVFGVVDTLGRINLSYNKIQEVPEEAFAKVLYVQHVEFSYNNLSCKAIKMLLNVPFSADVDLNFQNVNVTKEV